MKTLRFSLFLFLILSILKARALETGEKYIGLDAPNMHVCNIQVLANNGGGLVLSIKHADSGLQRYTSTLYLGQSSQTEGEEKIARWSNKFGNMTMYAEMDNKTLSLVSMNYRSKNPANNGLLYYCTGLTKVNSWSDLEKEYFTILSDSPSVLINGCQTAYKKRLNTNSYFKRNLSEQENLKYNIDLIQQARAVPTNLNIRSAGFQELRLLVKDILKQKPTLKAQDIINFLVEANQLAMCSTNTGDDLIIRSRNDLQKFVIDSLEKSNK